jgi:hypothetical protein
MTPYLKAIDELNSNGFVSDKTMAQLTPAELAQAVEAATGGK